MPANVQESFNIRLYKEYFNFAAAHFLVFEDGTREELHGHNYRVEFEISGDMNADDDVFLDFLHVKPVVKAVCDSIDHRTLLPQFNPFLTVEQDANQVKATFHQGQKDLKDSWSFPTRDVLVLPIPNTSSERLAQYLCFKSLAGVRQTYPNVLIQQIRFTVEESRGQSASYCLTCEVPTALKDLELNLTERFESRAVLSR